MNVSITTALDLIADENYPQAQEQLKQLIALYPDEKELYTLYAYCENCIEEICENEKFDLPDESSNKTAPEVPDWERFHAQAQQAADRGNYSKANTILGLLWDNPPIEPLHPYDLNGRQPRSILCQERAICQFLQGNLQGAKNMYVKALDIELSAHHVNDPRRLPFLIKKKEYEEALRLSKIGTFTAYFSNRSRVFYQRYQLYKQMGNPAHAYNALTSAIRYKKLDLAAHPYACHSYDEYADWLIEQGDLKEALRQNSIAIALWPKFYGYTLKRAEIYARMGREDQARAQLELLEKGHWYRIESYLPSEKAKVYECMGDLKTAEAYYQKPTIHPLTRYDHLCQFYTRYKRKEEIAALRRQQRKEPRFQDRVSETELIDLL